MAGARVSGCGGRGAALSVQDASFLLLELGLGEEAGLEQVAELG